jgi:predicted DNA-binding protein YlxM (UPF0122 family)
MSARYKNQRWLRERYVEHGLTQAEIAEECGVTQPTISHFIDVFDIERPPRNPHHDETWLREKYLKDRLSMTEIAAICEVSVSTISNQIRRSGIESEGVEGYRNGMYGRTPKNAR